MSICEKLKKIYKPSPAWPVWSHQDNQHCSLVGFFNNWGSVLEGGKAYIREYTCHRATRSYTSIQGTLDLSVNLTDFRSAPSLAHLGKKFGMQGSFFLI